jgi:2-desacetyl-2-hydroxyethyl bacteriochlorophyllide A dehydrogenase
MKAVVVEQPNRVAYTDIDEPGVGPDDVLVRSREAGLCRTDIEMMTGIFTDPRWVRFPVIPGHEWSGTVVEVGADVDAVQAGDRVVCEGMIGCNRCRRCRSGQTQWCESIQALGFTRPGGYAELVAVPARVVHVLPQHVSFDAGVLVEPASVVLNGLDKARPRPGEAVGVIGVGTLGSLAIALLSLYSPATIVAYGVREEELQLAKELGAHAVALVGEERPIAADELDLVVETAGAPAAIKLATQLCRPGGRALLLGIAGEGAMLTVEADLFAGKDIALIGSLAYPAAVWSRVVELLAGRVLELDRIVTHRFPIGNFEDAISLMDDRRGMVAKVVLEHA